MTEVSVCRKDGAREPRWNCRAFSESFLETDARRSPWSRPQGHPGHRLCHFLFSSLCTWARTRRRGSRGQADVGADTRPALGEPQYGRCGRPGGQHHDGQQQARVLGARWGQDSGTPQSSGRGAGSRRAFELREGEAQGWKPGGWGHMRPGRGRHTGTSRPGLCSGGLTHVHPHWLWAGSSGSRAPTPGPAPPHPDIRVQGVRPGPHQGQDCSPPAGRGAFSGAFSLWEGRLGEWGCQDRRPELSCRSRGHVREPTHVPRAVTSTYFAVEKAVQNSHHQALRTRKDCQSRAPTRRRNRPFPHAPETTPCTARTESDTWRRCR